MAFNLSDYAGDYLKGTDLQGREHLVTIDSINEETVGEHKKLVMHFVNRRKTLPLNQGHIQVLIQAFGDQPGNCRGGRIIVFPEQTRTPSGQPAIGVRIKLPQAQAQAQPTQPQPQPQPPMALPQPQPEPGAFEDDIPF